MTIEILPIPNKVIDDRASVSFMDGALIKTGKWLMRFFPDGSLDYVWEEGGTPPDDWIVRHRRHWPKDVDKAAVKKAVRATLYAQSLSKGAKP